MAVPIQYDDDPGGDGGGGDGSNPPSQPPTTNAGIPGRTVFEFGIYKDEASSVLRILAYASLVSPDDIQCTGYLGIDGQVYQQMAVNLVLDNKQSKGAMPITMPAFVPGVAAGNHTITFSIRNLEPDGALQVLAGSTIEVTEIKQGAF